LGDQVNVTAERPRGLTNSPSGLWVVQNTGMGNEFELEFLQ